MASFFQSGDPADPFPGVVERWRYARATIGPADQVAQLRTVPTPVHGSPADEFYDDQGRDRQQRRDHRGQLKDALDASLVHGRMFRRLQAITYRVRCSTPPS